MFKGKVHQSFCYLPARIVLTALIAALVFTGCTGLTDTTSIPDAPSITGIVPGNMQLTVSWGAVEGAEFYDVYCGTSSTIPETAVQKDLAATTTPITALTNGTSYNVWVTAKNAAGVSLASAPQSGIPTGKPVIGKVTTGHELLIVSWAAVSGAGSYELYYSTSDTLTGDTAKVTASASPATITGLTNGTDYHIWLKAIGAPQATEASDPKTGKPEAIQLTGSATPTLADLSGVWDSGYSGDVYTVTGTTLYYDNVGGTIRYVNNFDASSGVIIIEYTEEGKAKYYDAYESTPPYAPIPPAYDPPGYFQAVYYKEFSTGTSVKMGSAFDASRSGHLAAPETATLAEAITKFTLARESDFISLYGAYTKQP
ncbi:MAG: fibronectin type III domain-containing protein [Treponema sp.]|jgi:hypothetical protein|nr:fibronectin type III domain-containing protein [Treponema sp.]